MNPFIKLHLDNLTREKQPVKLEMSADSASLYIYDVISPDWGANALDVVDAIANAGDSKTLNVHINSPGGDVFESRAIMAAIGRFQGKTVAHIDSLCASAATSIACACDEVVMAQGGMYMIHNASGMAWGDKQAMRDTADLLQKVELSIVGDYTTKTGMPAEEVVAMMNAETWMTADEALSKGFIDRISTKATAKNTWNLSAFKNAPPPDPVEPEPSVEPAPEAGFFMSQANANRLRLAQI